MATNEIHPAIEDKQLVEKKQPEPELNLLLSEEVLDVPLWKSLFAGIDGALFPKKQAPLVLTSKPVATGELWGDRLERPWWKSVFDNISDGLKSQGPVPKSAETDLDVALARPWYLSIVANIQDALFPKKLPPLELTSKPVPVRDIWGFYDNKRDGALVSTAVHVVMVGLLIGGTLWARHRLSEQPKVTAQVMPLLNDSDIPALPPSKTQVGGGGGGGDRDKLAATKGKLPKFAMEQITPPMVVVRNPDPKLAVEPTVVVPPQIKLAMNNLPNLGDPMAAIPNGPLSNGTGTGGGIGSGSGGGVGSGKGPGVGPGEGGGIGGGVFHVGGGVSAPRAIFSPDPEYSEEARKVKHQGTVVLALVVAADGRPRDIRVINSLGMGLDEKAIEAVSHWKFEPAMKDNKPVSVAISVEVEFRLY
jgi:periplasmic protein TonB